MSCGSGCERNYVCYAAASAAGFLGAAAFPEVLLASLLPAHEVLLLITDDLKLHRVVAKAVLVEEINGSDDCGSGWLVVVEQVATQDHSVHILLYGHLQNLLKAIEGVIFADLVLLPNALHMR